jgi:hypothetical protein
MNALACVPSRVGRDGGRGRHVGGLCQRTVVRFVRQLIRKLASMWSESQRRGILMEGIRVD